MAVGKEVCQISSAPTIDTDSKLKLFADGKINFFCGSYNNVSTFLQPIEVEMNSKEFSEFPFCPFFCRRRVFFEVPEVGKMCPEYWTRSILDYRLSLIVDGNTPLVKGHVRSTQKYTSICPIEPVITKNNKRGLKKCLVVAGSEPQNQNADYSMYSTFLTASSGSVLFSRSNLLKRKDLCFSCLRLGLIRHRRSKKPHTFLLKCCTIRIVSLLSPPARPHHAVRLEASSLSASLFHLFSSAPDLS